MEVTVQLLSRVRLCDPTNHSIPGLSVHHQLPEFTQTHVHLVGDAIQPSDPLLSPSPPAPNPSLHQGLFQWVNSSYEVAKVLEFQLQHQSFQWTSRTYLLLDGLVGSPCSPRDSQAGAAARSLQSCPTLCNPIDSSPPGFPIPGILLARTLEWVAISFSNAWKWKKWSRSVVSNPHRPHRLQPSRLLHPWDFPGKSTGVGCHCLLLSTCRLQEQRN